MKIYLIILSFVALSIAQAPADFNPVNSNTKLLLKGSVGSGGPDDALAIQLRGYER